MVTLKQKYVELINMVKLAVNPKVSPFVAQKYVANPLLLDKQNKFDFRIYMLVASVNPLIVYYHDGFLRVSLSKYDKDSKEVDIT